MIENNDKRGIVYILTNPEMGDLIKIGKTAQPIKNRMKELSAHSGVPVPFVCYYACEVDDHDNVEKLLHNAFGDHRINDKREFFRIHPERVKAALALVPAKDVTPNSDVVENQQEQRALNKSRAKNFNFSMVKINIGSELLLGQDETIKSIVSGNREIEYDGETGTLNKTTLRILKEKFHYNPEATGVQSATYWKYEGKYLSEIRSEMESETDDDS